MDKQLKENRNEWIGGVILIGLGLFFLVNQFIDFNWDGVGIYLLPALGAVFLLAGRRRVYADFCCGLGVDYGVNGRVHRRNPLVAPHTRRHHGPHRRRHPLWRHLHARSNITRSNLARFAHWPGHLRSIQNSER